MSSTSTRSTVATPMSFMEETLRSTVTEGRSSFSSSMYMRRSGSTAGSKKRSGRYVSRSLTLPPPRSLTQREAWLPLTVTSRSQPSTLDAGPP